MSNTIPVPVEALAKIAAFMERVPEVLGAVVNNSSEAPTVNRKEAQARVADLIKYAGLDPAKQNDFTNFISTNEGALKTIQSLTNKIAALQADVVQTRNLAIGGPSTTKSSTSGEASATAAWCEALLG